MINLLPPEVKEQISYARRNTFLLRWLTSIVIAIAGIGVFVIFGYLYMNSAIRNQAAQAQASHEQLQAQKLEETQTRVSEVSGNLKLANQVISKRVLFSKLIQQIGTTVPNGAVLTDLNITKLNGGIDLEFVASSYQTATQIQVNLQDPASKIFEKADILSIDCASANAADPRYPCEATIRALFAKNNPYLLVQQNPGANP